MYAISLCVSHAIVVIMLFWGLLTACGSPGVTQSEKDERRSLAFDVSGRYLEDSSGGTPAAVTIANENGLNDVMATLALRGGFSASDRSQLAVAIRRDDPKLDDNAVAGVVGRCEAVLASAQLSVGPTFSERGGENVALDHTGDTVEISLRKTVDQAATTADGTYALTVSLYMTGHKGTPRLGYETTPNTDDEGHGVNGSKGLLVSLTHAAPTGEQSSVLSEMQLSLGQLVKY